MSFDFLKTGALSGAFTVLDPCSIIGVNGTDAAGFLHNQLSNDIQHLDDAHVRRAGLCSPKGRLLASFLVWKSAEAVKLIDAHVRLICVGLAGDIGRCLKRIFPILPDEVNGKAENEAGVLIRLTD